MYCPVNVGFLQMLVRNPVPSFSTKTSRKFKELLMSKEHRNVLAGSKLQFWIKLANVNESFTECEEYNFRTGTKISANYVASSC